MSDEFVEDPICQSLLLHVINRMQKEYILLMVGKERKWMTSAVGALVTGKVSQLFSINLMVMFYVV